MNAPTYHAPFEHVLEDGRKILIRDVRYSDRERVRQAYLAASESTIYQRFFAVRQALSETELDHLTRVDQSTHVAWGAVDLASEEQPGVGIARFVRDDDNPQKAEIALAVADGWQGVGLGRLLLAVLYLLAQEKDVSTFWGVTLFENHTMAHWFRNLGASVIDTAECHEVTLQISETFPQLPATSSARKFSEQLRQLCDEWEDPD